MRLFKTRTNQRHPAWQRDHSGQAYANHGRFRLTVKRANESWFYCVSDMNGELPPVDSSPFLTEQDTIHAAQAELDESASELPQSPDY
jgi:hypothetical protein